MTVGAPRKIEPKRGVRSARRTLSASAWVPQTVDQCMIFTSVIFSHRQRGEKTHHQRRRAPCRPPAAPRRGCALHPDGRAGHARWERRVAHGRLPPLHRLSLLRRSRPPRVCQRADVGVCSAFSGVGVAERERGWRGHTRARARGGFEGVRSGDVELECEGEGGRHASERRREEGRDPLDVLCRRG